MANNELSLSSLGIQLPYNMQAEQSVLVDFGAGQLVQLFGNFLCGHFAVQLAGSAPLDLDRNDLALDLGSQFFGSSLSFGFMVGFGFSWCGRCSQRQHRPLQPDRAQIDEYRANQECQEELVGAV